MSKIGTSLDFRRSTLAGPILQKSESPKSELKASRNCFRYKKNIYMIWSRLGFGFWLKKIPPPQKNTVNVRINN